MAARIAVDVDRSAIGRSSNQRGKGYERQFALFLQVSGWPEAKRAVVTGFRTAKTVSDDPGDIAGTPGLVWDVKSRKVPLRHSEAVTMAIAVNTMRASVTADFGFLIERNPGNPVASWWAWAQLDDLRSLVANWKWPADRSPGWPLVRMRVADLVPLLHAAGYGDPVNPFGDAS
jgi:hypothetical protein